jgi:hypothetical protein
MACWKNANPAILSGSGIIGRMPAEHDSGDQVSCQNKCPKEINLVDEKFLCGIYFQ